MLETQGSSPAKQWVCLLLCTLPFFINLGGNALWDNNEPWYAEPPREMLETGNYLIPTYSYIPRLRKPPMTSWVILPFYLLFGVNEFSARLPGAIAVVLTILLTSLIGSRLLHRQAGFMAALILATTPRFFSLARIFHMDTFLTLFITAAIYFFLRAAEGRKVHFTLLAYGMTALAVLTKGPIGALIPLAVLALTAWGIKNRELLRPLLSPAGIGVLILLTLPWYLLMYAKFGGEFLRIHFLLEHLQRFFTARLGEKPFTFFLGEFFGGLLPWSPFTLPASWLILHRARELKTTSPDRRKILLPLFWLTSVLVLFSLGVGKRAPYLMPLYPGVALTVGYYFTEAPYLHRRPYRLIHQALCGILAFGFLGLGLPLWQMLHTLNRSPWEAIPLIGAPSLMAVAVVWMLWVGRLEWTGAGLVGITATLLWGLATVLPLVEPYRDVKPLALQVHQFAGPADLVGTYGTHRPSFQFYLGRRPFHACTQGEMEQILRGKRRVFFLAHREAFERLKTQSAVPLEVLGLGTSLSFRLSYWFEEKTSPFTQMVLAVSQPAASGQWQPDPARPYVNCRERVTGLDQP